MKKSIILLLLLAPVALNAQEKESENNKDYGTSVFIGLTGGVDYNINAFREDAYTLYPCDFYKIQPHYNIGVNFGVMVAKKFRPTLEFKFVRMSYGMHWNDFNSTFDKSITRLNYFNINLRLDYLLLSNKRLDVFLSPTIKSEMLISSKDNLYRKDGSKEEVTYNFIGEEYPKRLLGIGISSIIKYKITDELGVTLTPEYTYFGRKFVLDNDGAYQRFSVNLGVEVKF